MGIWFLMITFGAAFGYTVMGRIALLAIRLEFLFDDWLWLIDPNPSCGRCRGRAASGSARRGDRHRGQPSGRGAVAGGYRGWLFVSLGPDPEPCVRLIVNPDNVRWDGVSGGPNGDSTWDPAWTSATVRGPHAWTAEIEHALARHRAGPCGADGQVPLTYRRVAAVAAPRRSPSGAASEAGVPAHLGVQAAFQDAAGQQGPFGRYGRAARGDHLVDLGHQAGGVGHIRRGAEEELG